MASARASNRIMKEISSLQKPVKGIIKAGPSNPEDIFHWDALIEGPSGTVYEGGAFKIKITLPPEYPHKGPSVVFSPPCYHPTVDQKTGDVCIDAINNWAPTIMIAKVLTQIHELLANPNPHVIDAIIAEEFSNNRAEFDRKARQWVAQYAQK